MEAVGTDALARWPALVWAMCSALVLFWGTGLIASQKLIKQGVYSSYPVSRLTNFRRQVHDGFWICAEEGLYAYLALLNVTMGVVFWLLDFYHEGRAPPNANYFPVANPLLKVTEPDLRNPSILRPKRAAILRPRKVKGNVCGCWGYQLPPPPPQYDASVKVAEDLSEVKPMRPRWSDCQCADCSALVMTQSEASSRLFVRSGREETSKPPGCAPASTSAVVFLHGLFSSSSFWFDTNVIPRLERSIRPHRVVAPDLLGCGRSPRPLECAYTVADHIEALERSILARHGVQSFHLVAHSMGCTLALVLAARHPQRVRSITLIAPVYPPGEFDHQGQLARLPCASFFSFLQPFTVKGFRGLLVSKYYNLSRAVAHLFYARHTFWVSYLHKKWKRFPLSFIADYITNHHDAAWHMTHNSLLAGTHAVVPSLMKLRKLNKRVLVYHGVDDTSCHIALSREMRARFCNVELHEVPGFGHVDVLWKREEEPCHVIEREILAGDAVFDATNMLS